MMSRKGLFVACIVLTVLLLSSVAAAEVQLEVDGSPLEMIVVLEAGRSYLPLREFGETLGAEILWDHQEKAAYITKGNSTVTFTDGDSEYRLNGDVRKMDTEPYIRNGRIFVPVRYAAQGLGYGVVFDEGAKTVRLQREEPVLTSDVAWKLLAENSLEFTLTMKNTGDTPVEVEVPSGQDFDMVVKQDGKEIYRWSDGMFFTLALRYVTYAPGEENRFSWEWTPPAAGTYEIEVYYLGVSREEPVVRETLVVDWETSA